MIPPDGLTNDSAQGPEPDSLTFWILGTPVQQGSKTTFVVKGKAIMTDQNAKTLKPWRANVTRTAIGAAAGRSTLSGALAVVADFYMPRGATVKRPRPSVTPDLDKLIRSLLDGITDAKVWNDDGQVVSIHAREFYADERPAGVRVQINTIAA